MAAVFIHKLRNKKRIVSVAVEIRTLAKAYILNLIFHNAF